MNDFSPEEFYALLSPDEKEKCERLFDQRDRELFILTRGWLRKLLAPLTDTDPSAIVFAHIPNGKPFLEDNDEIQFSTAHSNDAFVITFTNRIHIGADVEKLDRCIAIDKLSDFIFSHAEHKQFIALREEDCAEALINCWTRKEALLKALGTGLSVPMNQVEVEFRPGEKPQAVSVFGSAAEGKKWHVESFDFLYNYRAAVAVRGEVKHVELFNLASLPQDHPSLQAELLLK